MKNNDIKINIIKIGDKPIYNTITLDYKPINLNSLTSEQKQEIFAMLYKTLDAVKESMSIKEINVANNYEHNINI